MTNLQKKLLKGSIIGAVIGAALSFYLWYIHLTSINIAFCTNTCESVVTGEYGVFLGIPWGALGLAFYLLLAIMQIGRLKQWKCGLHEKFACIDRTLLYRGMLIIGWVITLYLRYLEFFVLDEFCAYCWGSVGVMIVLSILELLVWKSERKANTQAETNA